METGESSFTFMVSRSEIRIYSEFSEFPICMGQRSRRDSIKNHGNVMGDETFDRGNIHARVGRKEGARNNDVLRGSRVARAAWKFHCPDLL